MVSDQVRQRQARGWTDEEIADLERVWRDGMAPKDIAARFGFASEHTLAHTVATLRKTKRAHLPSRGNGQRRTPMRLAAEARGCTLTALRSRVLGKCDREGVGFIDKLLDDGVTTPKAGG